MNIWWVSIVPFVFCRTGNASLVCHNAARTYHYAYWQRVILFQGLAYGVN